MVSGSVITLSSAQMLRGATVGIRRQIEARGRGLLDRHGYKGTGWEIHIEGALGEYAVALLMGIAWEGTINTFKSGADVGRRIQVRTRSRAEYELIVRESDRDEDIFVLVVGTAPTYTVVGYILGKDAKRRAWLKTHGGRAPAYFVPHSALRPLPTHNGDS